MGDGAKREERRASEAATTSPARTPLARAPTGPLVRGRRIGNYVVLDELAAGGFGVVYMVENVVLGRRAARSPARRATPTASRSSPGRPSSGPPTPARSPSSSSPRSSR